MKIPDRHLPIALLPAAGAGPHARRKPAPASEAGAKAAGQEEARAVGARRPIEESHADR